MSKKKKTRLAKIKTAARRSKLSSWAGDQILLVKDDASSQSPVIVQPRIDYFKSVFGYDFGLVVGDWRRTALISILLIGLLIILARLS